MKKILILYLLLNLIPLQAQPPKLSIVFVVDQFAYHYLYKLKNYFTGGLKFLLDNGIVYENAHYPHAIPETAIGHTALNTGVYAFDHGIVGNSWLTDAGKVIEADEADAKTAAVFGPGCTLYDQGRSSANIMVDGLSEQCVLSSQPGKQFKVFSISIKSRAAICTSGKSGKPIWFDKLSGLFTSSKAYFDQLPAWVHEFNNAANLEALKSLEWRLVYPRNSKAYNFQHINNYAYAQKKEGIAGTIIPIIHCAGDKDSFGPLYQSPFGNELTLRLAQTCIDNHIKQADHLLVWVGLSPLDLLGHYYGPESLECIDLIYHLDKQLKKFMQTMQHKVGKNNILFALTADHGVLPMQEFLQEQGIKTARKLKLEDVMKAMNNLVQSNYSLDNFVIYYEPSQFYFNRQHLKALDQKKLSAVVNDLKKYLLSLDGIKRVWTNEELNRRPVDIEQQELITYFANQRYTGRGGDLIVQLQPYCLLTNYAKGTSHESCYNYDTHVPLVIYQKGVHEKKKVTQRVYMTQFANTMAQILEVPKPSASTAQLLPGIFDPVVEEKKVEVGAQIHPKKV